MFTLFIIVIPRMSRSLRYREVVTSFYAPPPARPTSLEIKWCPPPPPLIFVIHKITVDLLRRENKPVLNLQVKIYLSTEHYKIWML